MAQGDASGGARGFVFADLRGYTRFVETHGDDAGAELLARYRTVVRAVLDEVGGAEIRTEGDSFYLVFPSARRAVLAGLALVERAATESAAHPEAPIAMGVGIHAGETTETAEGYVGSAVNIAARICAQARAGEVLVSDTVRSLTRTGVPVTFMPRGRPRLKGIDEPIGLFAAHRPGTAPAAAARPTVPVLGRRVPLWMAGGAAAVVVLAFVASGLLAGNLPGSPGGTVTSVPSGTLASESPRTTPSALASGFAETSCHTRSFEIKRYSTSCFRPPFSFSPGTGWGEGYEETAAMLLDWTDPHAPLSTEFTNAHELTIFHFTAGFRNCASVLEIIGAGPAAVIDWLKGGDAFTVSNVSTLPALGTSALAVDFDVTGKCADVEVPFFTSADGTGVNVLVPGHHFRIVVADVAGTTMTALLDGPKSDFPVFAPEARRLLESVRFDGT